MSRLALVPLALLLAVAALLASAAQAWQGTSPAVAAAAFPLDGTAKENFALALYETQQIAEKNPQARPSAAMVALAEAAYRREPLAPHALYIIERGWHTTAPDRVLPLLEKANGLSRRSNVIAVDLLAAYSTAGQEHGALTVVDQILRRETTLHGKILLVMAKAAGRRDLHEALLKLLGTRPPWGDQFWRQLAQTPEGLNGAADLRLGFAREGGRVDPQIDRLLIGGLADSGRQNDALRLAIKLFPQAHIGSSTQGNLLRNASFKATPDFLPFDWRLMNSGNAGASRSTNGEGLDVSALAGSREDVGEQLVQLPEGKVRLSGAALVTQGSSDRDALHIGVICASGPHQGATLASATAGQIAITLPTDDCRWAWVRIRVELPSDAQATEWRISRLALTRV